MLTYKDLRKVKKGIVLLSIETFSIIGLFLYVYFFKISVSFLSFVFTMNQSYSSFVKLFAFLLVYAFLSYFIYYTNTLGFLYQINISFPLGFIISDVFSSNLFLSVACCMIITVGCYYIQIIHPIHTSKKQYIKDQEANGITQYKYLGTYANGQKKLNRFLDRYDSLNNKAMHIFSNIRSSGQKYPEQFSFLSKQIQLTKEVLLTNFKDLCEANDKDFEEIALEIRIALDEFDSDVSSLHTLFTLHLSTIASSFPKQSTMNTEENINANKESFDFFLGCTDLVTLKKRYYDLMKAYHSDGSAGNEQISKDINLSYEKAKNLLS